MRGSEPIFIEDLSNSFTLKISFFKIISPNLAYGGEKGPLQQLIIEKYKIKGIFMPHVQF